MKTKEIPTGEFRAGQELKVSDLIEVKAGTHDLFGDLEPDETKAYFSFSICRALPKVIGPESSGKYFAIHPQVLARSHTGLLHQQTNLHHRLKAYGNSHRDAINGCVISTAVPVAASRMEIPDTVEEAPSIQVLAVMFKLAQGVTGMMGEHLTKKPWSVSIESRGNYNDSGVYDPGDRSITPIHAVEGAMKKFVTFDAEKGSTLGIYKGNQLAMALGGKDGKVKFDGVGYTPNPAEDTAEITSVRASELGEFSVAACAAPLWWEGQGVKWTPIFAHGAGHGMIKKIHYGGEISMNRDHLTASAQDPVLEIVLPYSGRRIARHASAVKPV